MRQKGLTILSKNSQDNSQSEPVQLPLKGFVVQVPSKHPEWDKHIEGMGDGRVRIHMTKNKSKQAK